MNLAGKLKNLRPKICPSPWKGYEHYKGYGVMVLPFSSGHILGLRVFPENDFAPYHSVWHRSPEGEWTIYNDGPSLKTTCPRWWGPALKHAELNQIGIEWTGPNDLRIEMQDPPLIWTMTMAESPLLRMLNPASASMPLHSWRGATSLRLREWMARHMMGMGNLRFSFLTPSGQQAIIMPQQSFYITGSRANLKGLDLGHPVHLKINPTIGNIALPRRPVFMVGQAHAKIKNTDEYHSSRNRV